MGFDGLWACASQFCRRHPPLCYVSMQLVGNSNDKMVEGHPPLGVVKTNRGWRSLGAAIATLPSSKHSLQMPRLSGCWMKA